jgi:hypothetical protein
MIETKGLGAGSYPEPKENEKKCFKFTFTATVEGYGMVYAKSRMEAISLIMNQEYDDIIDTYNLQIEDVNSLECDS